MTFSIIPIECIILGGDYMGVLDWLSIAAIVFAIISFIFSYKWSQDSNRNLVEIRRVAEEIKKDVEDRTKDIDRRVEYRTEKIESVVSERTKDIERILEDRLRDLIDRAAPKVEDKALGDFLSQYGGQIFMEMFKDPNMMREIMKSGQK